ncbi:beta-lactamase family protein [Actinomadura graeca]|uniref:Beta-lactamase family protein n=1 Tax=Actinomadura graeca TaxID=2750812 RepID=A0ABX8QTL0_9ACTN|nr:beta-lactamase family protein [Actinomadura graeca]
MRQLLQHTSGLYDYVDDLDIFAEGEFEKHRYYHHAPEQLVEIAMRHRPDFPAGDISADGNPKWKYSNTGYALAGMIITRVAAHPWEQEAKRRIVWSLGLAHTPSPRAASTRGRTRGASTSSRRTEHAETSSTSTRWAT